MNIQKTVVCLDDIINDIGFGKFQIKQYFVVALILLNYISHVMLSGYILPSIINHWNLSLIEQSFLGAFEYGMQLIGSLMSSYSTSYGRKNPILISVVIWTVSVFMTSIFDNFYAFCLFRGITSCCSLTCNAISYTLLTEVLPIKYRGKLLGTFEIIVIFGQLQLVLVMSFTYEKLGEGNILLFNFVLFLIMLGTSLICFLFCEESPRFLCFNKKNECISLLNKISQENKKDVDIYMTYERQEGLTQWIKIMKNEEINTDNQEKASFRSLFKGHYKLITITLFFVWFANCTISSGKDYIYPLTLYKLFDLQGQSVNSIMIILYINLIIIPFLIPAILIVDMKMFGRKNTVTLSFWILCISCFFIWLDVFFSIFVWFILAQYAISINYMILSMYTNEIYPTKLRSLGFGTALMFGKFGAIFSPTVSIYLSNVNPHLPFALFSIISFAGGILLVNLKFDTTNQNMERILEDVEMTPIKTDNA